MNIFETVHKHINDKVNVNARYNYLDYATRVWIKLVCQFADERINALEKRVKELEDKR